MNLAFDYIWIRGFRSFDQKAKVYFKPGLHYVKGENHDEPELGPNGAGKSSIFDALCWVLYGKTPRNLRNPDIVPWHGNEKTKVVLHLIIDHKAHKIIRTANPNNLTINKQKVGQEDVVKLVGISYDVFTHTVLLAQGQPLFFDKTPSEKMQVLSDVLNLERWEARSEIASTRVGTLTDKKNELLSDLNSAGAALAEIGSMIEVTNERRKEWEEHRTKVMDSRSSEIETLEKQLENVTDLWGRADLAADGAGTEADALERDLDKQQEALRKASLTLEKAELRLADAKARLKDRQKQLTELENKRICPTCGQPVAKHKEMVKRFKREIEELSSMVNAGLSTEISEEVEALNHKVATTRKHLQSFKLKAEQEGATASTLKATKLELETKVAERKKVRQGHKELTNPYLDQLGELKKKRSSFVYRLEELKELVGRTDRAIERCKFWVKGFKDVRLFIVEELLTELELVTNTMLEDLGLVGWAISYSIEKETKSGSFQRGLNVEVRSTRNPSPVRWEVWSGGEGQRLRLIGSLALSEVLLNEANVHPNLEILDEPSRGMSTGGVDDLIEMLAARAEQTQKSILFVDHHLVRSAKFTSTIHVTRDAYGSSIAVE